MRTKTLIQNTDPPRDYSHGLTFYERALLESIRQAGYDLMAAILENKRSGQRWESSRVIQKKRVS